MGGIRYYSHQTAWENYHRWSEVCILVNLVSGVREDAKLLSRLNSGITPPVSKTRYIAALHAPPDVKKSRELTDNTASQRKDAAFCVLLRILDQGSWQRADVLCNHGRRLFYAAWYTFIPGFLNVPATPPAQSPYRLVHSCRS